MRGSVRFPRLAGVIVAGVLLVGGALAAQQSNVTNAVVIASLQAMGLFGSGYLDGQPPIWDVPTRRYVPGPVIPSGGLAPTNATYITQIPNATLTNEQALSALATGLLKSTTATGVVSIAASGTDYAPATSGSAALLGNGAGGFANYAGVTCTNQFLRVLSTAIAGTCASVSLTADVTGTLAATSGGTGQASYAVGDLLAATSTTALSRVAAVAAGSYLRSVGVSTLPAWSTLILPNTATATRLVYATSNDTWGESANLTYGANGLYVATAAGNASYTIDAAAGGAVASRVVYAKAGTDEWVAGYGAFTGGTPFELATLTTSAGVHLSLTRAGALQLNNYGAGTLTSDASGNVTAVSDERLKRETGRFDRGLDVITQLRPIRYYWNQSTDQSPHDLTQEYVGFGAQSVQRLIPEAVFPVADGRYLSLQDRPIIAALVNAVQELSAKVDQLEAARRTP